MKRMNEIVATLLWRLLISFALLVYASLPETAMAATAKPTIGVIGAGKIGGTVGEILANAGYPVMLSARDVGPVKELAAKIGHGARAGTPEQAAAFGKVIVMAVPWGVLPQVGKELAAKIRGKVVLDTCNPRPQRDGDLAKEGLEKGTGVTDPQFLPGTRLVRAFNALSYTLLASSAHRPGEPVAIPLASDDKGALEVASQIVTDAGFVPVVVGGLSTAKSFDQGTPNYATALTASELRKQLHIE
jgi:predicted dinucleotide-binding enzyme